MLVSNYVTRAQWGAAKPLNTPTALPISLVNRIFVHYTGMDADEQASHSNCAARVRGIQRFHQSSTPSDPTKPWNDIAYSFIVCKHGFVYEGRGFGVRTAATGPCNNDSYAVCFLGDDTSGRDDVTDLGRDAIAEIVAEIEARRGKNLLIRGHRDCMGTTCPGGQIYTWIRSDAFRRQVEAQSAPVPKWEWYIAAGGNIVLKRPSIFRLATALATNGDARDRVRDAIVATEKDHGRIGRRKV